MKIVFANLLWSAFLVLALTGCRRDMFDQPKANPLRESDAFPDNAAARPIPPHTVPQGHLNDEATGSNTVSLSRALLERGHERYEISCAPCHGLTGEGDGVVVQRGFPRPPSYHIDRLRTMPVSYFFNVMTRGYGAMYPQAAQITPEDRWAIAFYIQALQLSQYATPAEIPAGQLAQLRQSP